MRDLVEPFTRGAALHQLIIVSKRELHGLCSALRRRGTMLICTALLKDENKMGLY